MSKTVIIAVIVILLVAAGAIALSSQNKNFSPAHLNTSSQSEQSPSATPTSTMSKAKEVTIEGNEFKFEPNTLNLTKGEKVKLTFKNQGKYPHNLTIPDLSVATKTIQPGQTDTIEFTPAQTGTFSFMCTVDSHEQKGMKGTATIQ